MIKMLTTPLLLICVAICFSPTVSVIGDSKENFQPQVTLRTWEQAIAMAKTFIAQLTLQEKCHLTAGVGGPCAGNIASLPRVNFSGFCLLDTPSGVGDGVLYSTAFVGGIHIAATWDRDLFYRRAVAIGKEFRGKGVHYALGPMVNIDRNARHGRNWEGFGSDPYLSGENAFFYTQGVQDQGVVVTVKHYICNEQDTHRSGVMKGANDPVVYSANLDDKTMHEIYLWPFASSVTAGTGSVMCSANEINETRACQNNKTQNGLLKGELGYMGNILTDWMGSKSTVDPVLSGLDIDMPGNDGYMGDRLVSFVQNGSIPQSRIDDMAIRIIAPYYLVGQDQDFPTIDLDRDAMENNYIINREASRAGMILLKNVNNALPLNSSVNTNIYIYGQAAGQTTCGLEQTSWNANCGGALYQGGGSGFVRPAYALDPLTALMQKGRDDRLQIRYITNQNDFISINRTFHDRSFQNAKCLVFISAWSEEGIDRTDLYAFDNGEQLVLTVAQNCRQTIVLVNSVSQLNLERWIDHPNVVGVLWTGMPGSEYGPALVDVLFGDYNPGGKLVFSLAKNDSDFGTDISPTGDSNYTEGVFLDYRHFDKYNITPRYYFGYGLSYTNFSFDKLEVSQANDDNDKNSLASLYKQSRMRPYNNFDDSGLYEPVYTITFTIQNTGNYYGSEVAQLYLGFPTEAQEPLKILRGFERVYLEPNELKEVALVLSQKDISYWNVVNQQWTIASGIYTVWISTSANNADIKLQGSFNV
jgi:beta-glucosidase